MSHTTPFRVRQAAWCLSLVLLLCVGGGWTAQAETANRIVAIVNDEIITEADLLDSTNALLSQESASSTTDPSPGEVRRVALGRLIEQRLLVQEAKRQAIVVGEDEVLQRFEALQNRFPSEEVFEQSLAESHLTGEQLKSKLRDQLMVQRLIDAKVRATIMVSPQEVASEVVQHPELAKSGDRVQASHILVRVGDQRSEASARSRIDDVYTQLQAGGDFASLAKRYSEDEHAADGGAMGWVAPGDLLPELDAALAKLKPGEYSSPIQTRLGFHLVKLDERRAASSLSSSEANRAVYQQIYQQKFQSALIRWLTELKEHAYIDIPKS